MTEPIRAYQWRGNLRDDCSLRVGPYLAHVEMMDKGLWYCQVVRKDPACRGHGKGGQCSCETVFHSTDEGVGFRTGRSARAMCEWIIRRELVR